MAAFLLHAPLPSLANERQAVALITIDVSHDPSGLLAISASATALQDANFRAELIVSRVGMHGEVSLRQERSFVLTAGGRGEIGKLNISFADGDTLQATATVWNAETVVATAVTSINGR